MIYHGIYDVNISGKHPIYNYKLVCTDWNGSVATCNGGTFQ